jgi:hypothetical protein
MKMDSGAERHALIQACAVGWNVVRGENELVKFDKHTLESFLNAIDPRLVEALEVKIRKANPWLLGDMSVEDIDKEIENLQELRAAAVEREAGEQSSSSR